MVGLPLILFQAGEEDDLNEFEYLASVARGDLPTGILVPIVNFQTGTIVIGTVPTGKDWYLIGWDVSAASTNANIILEFPTGTNVAGMRADDGSSTALAGVPKGLKIVDGNTITILRSATISNIVSVFILQVDTGASIIIP